MYVPRSLQGNVQIPRAEHECHRPGLSHSPAYILILVCTYIHNYRRVRRTKTLEHSPETLSRCKGPVDPIYLHLSSFRLRHFTVYQYAQKYLCTLSRSSASCPRSREASQNRRRVGRFTILSHNYVLSHQQDHISKARLRDK
jgi:hypothetical protein